jgi:hypothetical protein
MTEVLRLQAITPERDTAANAADPDSLQASTHCDPPMFLAA